VSEQSVGFSSVVAVSTLLALCFACLSETFGKIIFSDVPARLLKYHSLFGWGGREGDVLRHGPSSTTHTHTQKRLSLK
jgi:hypothetical protein